MVPEIKNERVPYTPVRRRPKSGERGNVLLEFALTMVILLVLLFGIIDFGRALYSYHFISEAAREGTRFASVRGFTCSASALPCPASPDDIRTYIQQIVPQGIDPASVTVNPTWWNPNNLPICNSPATNNYPGCAVQVQVGYNFKFIFPYNFDIIQFSAAPVAMSSTSRMIISR